MLIFKLFIITLFLYFSSKSYGIFIGEKFNLKNEVSLGMGYLGNLAAFFVAGFITMFFKLSTAWLMVFGGVYLLFTLYVMFLSIKKKELFKFENKEIICIVVALIFVVLYGIFVEFGNAEMYDSYFYSILTNSASNAKHLSTINPYNGIGDLQNFYKYMSYYYQASFFANILQIKPAYLALIWPFTFMNYFFFATTALGVCRVSKNRHINNILSIFMLTFFTSIFRSPFNALYMINIVLPVYMLTYVFDSFKDKKNISLYYITFLAAVACTSAILYTSVAVLFTIFISKSLNKDKDHLDVIYKIAIPTYCLGVLYLIEDNRSLLVFAMYLAVLIIGYLLVKLKPVKTIARWIGVACLVAVPILFVLAPKVPAVSELAYSFMNQTEASDKYVTTSANLCISDIVKVKDIDISSKDINFGTAMTYIYNNSHSLFNTLCIIITHSIPMYGGMLAFFILSIWKKKDKDRFLCFVTYIILFFNPLVAKGLALMTLNLNDRIYLFFNTYFALYGLYYFVEWVESWNWKWVTSVLRKSYIVYLVLLIISVGSYVAILKKPDFKNNNFLYKVPNNLVQANKEVNSMVSKKNKDKKKPVVLYTVDTLNLTMIDGNPNNKYKLIDSKDYKSYYFDVNSINNKMVINIYFESAGELSFDNIKNKIKKNYQDDYKLVYCSIDTMLEQYNVSYIVMLDEDKDSYEGIKDIFKEKYHKNGIIVLERNA